MLIQHTRIPAKNHCNKQRAQPCDGRETVMRPNMQNTAAALDLLHSAAGSRYQKASTAQRLSTAIGKSMATRPNRHRVQRIIKRPFRLKGLGLGSAF